MSKKRVRSNVEIRRDVLQAIKDRPGRTVIALLVASNLNYTYFKSIIDGFVATGLVIVEKDTNCKRYRLTEDGLELLDRANEVIYALCSERIDPAKEIRHREIF